MSPWASPVVLVHKKDGSLWFCIDLRKLNNQIIKDAQSLPRIEDSLDCLNGATIFTSLNLQSGYWQVEMTEDSKPLTAFTVGPLGFYKCVQMPFVLTNALGVFSKLAATGLRLKPSKCEFFKSKVNYLGQIVSKEGMETDPKKSKAIKKWPVSTMVTKVRSFLGFTNYYHKFIP